MSGFVYLFDEDRQLTTFWVHGYHFGVDVAKVQEVLRPQEMTRVPLAPPVVSGLINLRGEIVTAVDLRRYFDLPKRPPDERPMNVIVRCDGRAVSLLVDEIGEVVEVAESCFEQAPATVRPAVRALVQGVYKLPGQLLLLLDADLTISSTLAPQRPGAVAAKLS